MTALTKSTCGNGPPSDQATWTPPGATPRLTQTLLAPVATAVPASAPVAGPSAPPTPALLAPPGARVVVQAAKVGKVVVMERGGRG